MNTSKLVKGFLTAYEVGGKPDDWLAFLRDWLSKTQPFAEEPEPVLREAYSRDVEKAVWFAILPERNPELYADLQEARSACNAAADAWIDLKIQIERAERRCEQADQVLSDLENQALFEGFGEDMREPEEY